MEQKQFQQLVEETLTEQSFAKWSHFEEGSDTVKITAQLSVNIETEGIILTKSLECSTLTENSDTPIRNAIIAIDEKINKHKESFLNL